MNTTPPELARLAFIISLVGLTGIAAPARADPSDEPIEEAQPGEEPTEETPQPEALPEEPPQIIGEAWRNGRAEVDVGQGWIGKLTPKGIEWLADRGIQFFAWWMISLQGNPFGGIDKAFRYSGLLDFGIDLDMETMAGLTGFWIHVSGSWASGKNLSTDVGTFAPVNAVYSGDSLRLFEMYLEERILNDRLSFRVGRLSIGWEYGLEYDFFTQYQSAAFRLNVFALDGNTPNFSVIPFANWGARVRWTPRKRLSLEKPRLKPTRGT